jgi:hypothetical protein
MSSEFGENSKATTKIVLSSFGWNLEFRIWDLSFQVELGVLKIFTPNSEPRTPN